MMDDFELAIKLNELAKKHAGDIEAIHWEADELLLEKLAELGYLNTVSAFNELPKWYA